MLTDSGMRVQLLQGMLYVAAGGEDDGGAWSLPSWRGIRISRAMLEAPWVRVQLTQGMLPSDADSSVDTTDSAADDFEHCSLCHSGHGTANNHLCNPNSTGSMRRDTAAVTGQLCWDVESMFSNSCADAFADDAFTDCSAKPVANAHPDRSPH